jgi:hypothetical protein
VLVVIVEGMGMAAMVEAMWPSLATQALSGIAEFKVQTLTVNLLRVLLLLAAL